MTNRLFIALKLPEDIVKEIVRLRDSVLNDNVRRRWEPDEKLHLTLKFLGDCDEKMTLEIEKKLEEITSKYHAFEMEFDRFGFFLPRILWLGLRTENALFDLEKEINNGMNLLGFKKENRNFKPHITILRIKDNLDPGFISAFNSFELPKLKFSAGEVSLVKSILRPQGSVYSDIRSFHLT